MCSIKPPMGSYHCKALEHGWQILEWYVKNSGPNLSMMGFGCLGEKPGGNLKTAGKMTETVINS